MKAGEDILIIRRGFIDRGIVRLRPRDVFLCREIGRGRVGIGAGRDDDTARTRGRRP